jgi:hypothetical protein
MKLPRKPMTRTLMIATTSVSAAILFSSAASTQESRQGTSSIPDLSSIWTHPSFPWYERIRGRKPTQSRSAFFVTALRLVTTCQSIRSADTLSTTGISSPSALAVLRLMTNSNFVDSWTGRSAGLAPLRMLPV